MLSVIFYGRNDNHGYNIQKRAALSLNNVAELLTHPDDEIIFVDWNTQFALPTFIEAIEDTLSQKAKSLIRVIKVSADVHNYYFQAKSKKQLIEPVARNVAIRRSSPVNQWILSTNLDMIFLPIKYKSLNEIVAGLSESYYGIPRFSLPEIYWDSLPRSNPKLVMRRLYQDCKELDLEEVVCANNIILYDAPGDFQLFSRPQIFKLCGFDERMIHGWHVDSNLAKRFFLLNGANLSLIDKLKGYHCEHTKIPTHFTSNSTQNNLVKFYEQIQTPFLNQNDWGLKDLDLEKVDLAHLKNTKETMLRKYSKKSSNRSPIYANDMGNLVQYSLEHSIPYIVDILESLDDEWKVIYIGKSQSNFFTLSELIREYKNINLIDYYSDSASTNNNASYKSIKIMLIIDFGLNQKNSHYNLSSYRHTDTQMHEFFKIREIVHDTLNLFISEYQDSYIFKWPIVTLNAETYDNGIGQTINRWITQPKVAANSRVRSGFFKVALKNRDKHTLIKLRERSLKLLYPLKEANFQSLNIELDEKRNEFSISGHNIYPYIRSKRYLNLTPRGLFLKDSGKLSLNIKSKQPTEKLFKLILEFDKPTEDHYFLECFLEFNNKFLKKSFVFLKDSSSTFCVEISNLTLKELKNLELDFHVHNTEKFRDTIRLVNLMIYSNLSSKKIIFINPSYLQTREVIKSGVSFSNEGKIRWITDREIDLTIPKDVIYSFFLFNFPRLMNDAIQLKNKDNFEAPVKYDVIKSKLLKNQLYLIIYNLERNDLDIGLSIKSDYFERYSLSEKDSRKLLVSLNSIFLIKYQMNIYFARIMFILRVSLFKLIGK